ncbi:MAG: DMT family transporter [Alphaproteobacteria bacterium]
MTTGPVARETVRTQVLRGIMFMCLAATVLPVMNAMVKYLSAEYHTAAIIWARTGGHFVFVVLAFGPAVGRALFRTQRLGLQLTRSGLHLLSMLSFFTGIAVVPLAEASAITFIAPFVVTALSGPMLGEKVGIRRWSAVVVGFAGALVVVRPGTGAVPPEAALIFVSATCYGIYQILTRRVAAGDRPEVSAVYSGLVGTAVMTLAVPFFWVWPTSLLDAVLFLSLGILGAIGHYFLARAFMWGPASVIAPFNYGQLIIASTCGYLVFGQAPDRWTWTGAAIIVASGLYIAYRETRRRAESGRTAA